MAFNVKLNLDNPLLDEDDDETYTPPAEHFNPVLDEDDEETVTRPSASTSKPAEQPTEDAADEDSEDAARLAERKAKRAEKRAENHAEHPVWYRRRAGREGKDQDFLNFLVRFKYAKASQLAALHSVSKHTAYKRLKGLESYGYVWERKLHDQSSIWLPTYKGVSASAHPQLKPPPQAFPLTQLEHNLVVAHVASNWAGGVFDVLDLGESFLKLKRQDSKGKDEKELRLRRELSHRMVTEMQIRAALKPKQEEAKANLAKGSDSNINEYTAKLIAEGEWDWWKADAGQAERWAFYTPKVLDLENKYRLSIPDLVLVHPLKPHTRMAVEIETSQKRTDLIRHKLNAYKQSKTYDRVIYVVPDPSTRKLISKLAKELDLGTRFEVIPLYVQNKDGNRLSHDGTDWRF